MDDETRKRVITVLASVVAYLLASRPQGGPPQRGVLACLHYHSLVSHQTAHS